MVTLVAIRAVSRALAFFRDVVQAKTVETPLQIDDLFRSLLWVQLEKDRTLV